MTAEPLDTAAFVNHLTRRAISQADLEGESFPRARGNLNYCHTRSRVIDPSQPIGTNVGEASPGQIFNEIEDPSTSPASAGHHDRDAVIG